MRVSSQHWSLVGSVNFSVGGQDRENRQNWDLAASALHQKYIQPGRTWSIHLPTFDILYKQIEGDFSVVQCAIILIFSANSSKVDCGDSAGIFILISYNIGKFACAFCLFLLVKSLNTAERWLMHSQSYQHESCNLSNVFVKLGENEW